MLPDLESAYSHCEKITRNSAKNFFYAFQVLPKEKRRAIYVIYSFCRICDDIADGHLSKKLKFQKLEKISEIFKNTSLQTPAMQNQVFLALEDVISKYKIPKKYFTEFVDGMVMDQKMNRFANFSELELYCYRVASVVGLMCIEIFGYKGNKNEVFEYAKKLGIAMQLTNIVRDIKDDIKRNRIYIPQSEMLEFGYEETQLKEFKYSENFYALMAFQIQRIRSFFDGSSELNQHINEDSQSCINILRTLYLKILDKIEESDYKLYGPEISLSKREKITIMLSLWIGHIAMDFTNKYKSIIIK